MADLTLPWQLAAVTLASWWITRLIVVADFPPTVWLRQHIWARWPAADTMYPDDGTIHIPDTDFPTDGIVNGRVPVVFVEDGWYAVKPHWLGQLISCPWCVSPYVTAVVVALWQTVPQSLWLWLVLAIAGLVGLIATRVDV